MLLPIEFVTWRAYGSIRDRSPCAVRIVNRYSVPGPTPGTWADQVPVVPSPSGLSWVRSPAQSSNVPVTKTASACGAQTRNVVPSSSKIAPMPGAFDGAMRVMHPTIAAPQPHRVARHVLGGSQRHRLLAHEREGRMVVRPSCSGS